MDIQRFDIAGPILIKPSVFEDERGFFMETFNAQAFEEITGVCDPFVQDNHSFSRAPGTVRGLHYQAPPYDQGKLVRCTRGGVIDAIVDIRSNSPTYGQSIRAYLSGKNKHQLWVPPGFLHGFCTIEADTEFLYKVTQFYHKASEGGVLWNDPDLNIDWGLRDLPPQLSGKDKEAPMFADFTTPF